jgi:hypothetical protein
LKCRKVLVSKFKIPQEAISQPTLHIPQGSQDTHTIKSASYIPDNFQSPEVHKHKEKQSLDEQLYCPPRRFPASQELVQPKGKFPGKTQCQAKDKHGPSQPNKPYALTYDSSNGVQKVESSHSERPPRKGLVMFKLVDPSKSLEQDQRRDPEDLPWSSGSPSLKDLIEEVESYLRPTKCNSGPHFATSSDKERLAKVMEDHLGRKLELIKKGMIPMCVQRSWLAANNDLPKSNTQTKPMNQGSCKGQQSKVNTSQELSFLDPKSHLLLEAHIVRYWVRHKWDPHMQAFEPKHVNLSEIPVSPLPQPAIPSSADYTANGANFLEELPHKGLKEKATRKMSVAPLQSLFTAHSTSQLQRAQTINQFGGIWQSPIHLDRRKACPFSPASPMSRAKPSISGLSWSPGEATSCYGRAQQWSGMIHWRKENIWPQ